MDQHLRREEPERGAFVSLPASPAFVVNDPAYAPRGAPWMRGITPARLGLIALVCLLMHIDTPAFVDEPFFIRAGRTLHNAAIFLISPLPLLFIVVRTEMATAGSTERVRIWALVAAVVSGAALFALVRHGLRLGSLPHIGAPGSIWQYSLGHFIRILFLGALFTSILYYAASERAAARRLHLTRLSRVEVDKQMTEARLKLLQAQIEPHFLFNSLASVKRLYEKDPSTGRSLLRNLSEYLRVAVSRARSRDCELGEEIALARSFLAIFEVRMGARLRVRIDVPVEVGSALVPPLMVGTLVENSIKHGIGPRASGGLVSITARRHGDRLEIAVADDGVGFRARSGHGVGLANTRARLETLYGGAGRLDLVA